MIKKHTPWIPTIRVILINREELIMLRKMHGCKNIKMNLPRVIDRSAIIANNIIHNLINKGKENGTSK